MDAKKIARSLLADGDYDVIGKRGGKMVKWNIVPMSKRDAEDLMSRIEKADIPSVDARSLEMVDSAKNRVSSVNTRKQIAQQFEEWADELAKEEQSVVSEGGQDISVAFEGQNAKFQDNWPTGVWKERMAGELVRLAGRILGETSKVAKVDAKDLIVDSFGVSPGAVRGDEVIGTQSYPVAIGSARGKWYGVEATGRSPQVWEARSRASLLSEIYKDTGIKASTRVAGSIKQDLIERKLKN